MLVIPFFDMVLGCAFVNRACACCADHRRCMVGFAIITVFTAFAAILRAGFNIGALAIAICFSLFTLCAAFTASADKAVRTFGAGGTAAIFGILGTFACVGIDVKAVNTLQKLARALRAGTGFPACDSARAGSAMQTAVVRIVELACIFKDVHAFGACFDRANRLYAIAGCPAIHGQTA